MSCKATEYRNTELASRVVSLKLADEQNRLRGLLSCPKARYGSAKRLRAKLTASIARSLEVDAGRVWP